MKTTWYSETSEEALRALNTSTRGLSSTQAKDRLLQYGPNKLPETKPESMVRVFFRQFASPLIYILFAAAIIIFALGDPADSYIILAVLLFNAIIGTVQEGRAARTLEALKQFSETTAAVLRDGNEVAIADAQIVPGDIVIIREGEKIPADCRIISTAGLKIDESAATGESVPISKSPDAIEGNSLAVSDQRNMVFKGTYAVSGSAVVLVVATGSETFIGGVAATIAAIDTEIPLKKDITKLSRTIVIVVLAISAALFLLGIWKGETPKEMFVTVVSLAVSIVPEGLPIVVTLILAIGVSRMSKRNALVKRLQAVEALGQATVIAVDKTGTITKNELVIRVLSLDGVLYDVSGSGYEPVGAVTLKDSGASPSDTVAIDYVAKVAAYCASAEATYSEESKLWKISGDPTEAAMLVFGRKLGFDRDVIEVTSPRIAEIPFDYTRKYHAVLHREASGDFLTVLGAPEAILGACTHIKKNGRVEALTDADKKAADEMIATLSAQGLRVIAISVREDFTGALAPETVGQLTFIGFFGMKDVLRDEVAEAVAGAREAGMRVVMITGDHRITAQAIAREAGIYHDGDQVVTGSEIEAMSDAELATALAHTSVFARVTPEHKMRIINAYKERGDIAAMTGDGVNDAPPLVAADLGIAMGKIGTEVAKEAADIVLLDDNFKSIMAAVEEGRTIFKTIKKVILYLFSTSVGEVLAITGAILVGLPLPLMPAQIIWLNFVTDGFLDISLAMEPKEKGLLTRAFGKVRRSLVDRQMAKRMLVMAIPMATGALILFAWYLDHSPAKALTVSLTTLAAFQWFNVWNCRSDRESIFQMNPFSNKSLVFATLGIIGLHIFAVYNPLMQRLLHTTALDVGDWLIIVSVALSIVVVEEARKFLVRKQVFV